jgi:Uma2 family endonuclease
MTVAPQTRRWTRDDFYRMARAGLFQGQRAELIDGEVMVLSPQNWPHASTVDRVCEVLRTHLDSGVWVRAQLPLALTLHSEPEPDISVVAGRRDDYSDHPATALLIVEVSDSTLDYDRGRKASLYASAGIADYWIVNLVDHQLEIHRQPTPDPTQVYGHAYASVTILNSAAVALPLAWPQTAIAVADLLP